MDVRTQFVPSLGALALIATLAVGSRVSAVSATGNRPGVDRGGPASARAPNADATGSSSAAARPALTVHIRDFVYEPADATVHVGDAVLFRNDDDVDHTVTADDRSFDSGIIAAGKSWVHTFTTPGTFAYICSAHPYMKATIRIAPGAARTPQPSP